MNAKDYSPEVFQMTAVVAKLNPDFYSIWNYRKDYITLQLENEGLYVFSLYSKKQRRRIKKEIIKE